MSTDPRPQRPGVSQIDEADTGALAVFDRNGRIMDAGLADAVFLKNLPTSDPHVVGQVWSNSGALTVSAG